MSTAAEFVGRREEGSASERDHWMEYFRARMNGADVDTGTLPDGRLLLLETIFGLGTLERELVMVHWLCAFSPELRRDLLARDPLMQTLSPLFISRLFDMEPCYRLGTASPLVLWDMMQENPLTDGSLHHQLDPQIISWLEGGHELDPWLMGRANIVPVSFELPDWQLEAYRAGLAERIANGESCRVFLETDDKLLAETFAAALAARLEVGLLRVDGGDPAMDQSCRFATRLQRQCFLDRVAALFTDHEMARTMVKAPRVFPLQFFIGTAGDIAGNDLCTDIMVEFKPLTSEQREVIWRAMLPEAGQWPEQEFARLLCRDHLTASEIKRIAQQKPAGIQDVQRAVRHSIGDDLDGLAHRLVSEFSWDDLVVPNDVEEQLNDIVFEARERTVLWSDSDALRLFPHGRGLIALFHGPAGSGKTMAAQVLANELGFDLLRVDLSAVVSKWVGETTQHLQRILSSKISHQSVLFFDEADALYAKRVNDIKDANDRFVNMDSGHLMVALENFDGIVIMATNLRANIDPAFIRRIRHTVEFNKPGQEARKTMWCKLLAALFDNGMPEHLGEDIDRLSQIEASGAQIKNACLSGLFHRKRNDEPLTAMLLGRKLCRELAKDGRGFSERELHDLLGNVK